MRKVMLRVISCLCIFLLTACSAMGKKEEKKDEQAESFNGKIATTVAQNYMKYLMAGDVENAKKLYSKEMAEKDKTMMESDLKILGYKTDEVNEVGKSALVKMKVARSMKEMPSAMLDVYTIKVIKEENDEYKIKEISSMNEKEVFQELDEIRIRQKNNVKTNLLLDLSGIPRYAFPKDDKANVSKAMVPNKFFGNFNFSYSGEKIAISTYDQNSFAAVVKIDESLAVQGAGGGQGGQGGGGQGSQGGEKGGKKNREVPIGKELISLDILKDSKIQYMSFSLDEKFVMIQYENKNKGLAMRVYNVDSGELIEVDLEKEFPSDKFDVVFYSFDNEVINFDVKQKGSAKKEDIPKIGRWQINLKDFKIKKL